ncbi:hypothetical protein [Hyphococcus sp. DH-69]|uniref:hypothetical protein n=1 Tax=Hyphococcus formosus TaxID=3143534 RepID=UPI00398ACB78
MAKFNLTISYDLYRPGQDYSKIINAIKQLGAAVKVHKSLWYLDSNYNEAQVRDALVRVIDANDTVFVVNSTTDMAAWFGLDTTTAETIRRRWNKSSPANRLYG